MLAPVLALTCLLFFVGCDHPTSPSPPPGQSNAPATPEEHAFAIYGVNAQSFLVDGKTGDVWVYGDTKDGKGFTSVPVLGLRGVTREYNPKTGKLEPYHEYPSWFHPLPENDPLGIRPENQPK